MPHGPSLVRTQWLSDLGVLAAGFRAPGDPLPLGVPYADVPIRSQELLAITGTTGEQILIIPTVLRVTSGTSVTSAQENGG